MNSTGESDEKMYRQTLEQERAIHITPVLERLIPILCRSAIGCFPAGATFKYPPLIEMSPQDKASVIDQQLAPLERLFQANLLPGDALLEAVRNAQQSLDITSTIRDEHIKRVRGKYQKDFEQQADPFGGASQVASEAGIGTGASGAGFEQTEQFNNEETDLQNQQELHQEQQQ